MLNKTNDKLFKAVFGSEKHKNITLALINSILEFEGTELLSDIAFINREIDAEYIAGKSSRLDLVGKSSDGTTCNLEVQIVNEGNMERRALYYWTRLYNSLKQGQDYNELHRSISIILLEYQLFPYPDVHSRFGIYNRRTDYLMTPDLEIHFLEIPKWKLRNIKEINRMEKWIAYFSNRLNEEEMEELAMGEPAIQEALKVESIFSKDEQAILEYERAEKHRRDYINAVHTFISQGRKEGMEEGMQRGIEQGIKQGIEQGIEKGMEKGIEQGRMKTAVEMLKNHIDVKTVAKCTHLPLEKIELLMKQL